MHWHYFFVSPNIMTTQDSRENLYYKIPVFILDLAVHLLVLLFLMQTSPSDVISTITDDGFVPALPYALLTFSFIVAISNVNLKLHVRRMRLRMEAWRVFKQTIITYLCFIVLMAMVYKETPRHLLVESFCIVMPLLLLIHMIANRVVKILRGLGHNTRYVVMVGLDETQLQMYHALTEDLAFTGYQVFGFFSSFSSTLVPAESKLLGDIPDFFKWIEDDSHRPDELYCSLPPATCKEEVDHIIRICNEKLIEFYFVPNFDGYPKRQLTVRSIGSVNYIKLREEPLQSLAAEWGKRAFDLVFSTLFLCTIYPFVLLFVWIGNKVTGNVGPLYFRQARTGYNGETFYIYKFRSMKVNAEADKMQATENDPRKTPFGDFLRRSSIDELPQFINVFKGDMSVIGPRPHMEYHTEVYSSLIADYMVRHLAKPGITGWAQISGCRGETRTVEDMKRRVEHDIWYIEHWTPLLDTEIFFKTLWQLLPGHDKQAY